MGKAALVRARENAGGLLSQHHLSIAVTTAPLVFTAVFVSYHRDYSSSFYIQSYSPFICLPHHTREHLKSQLWVCYFCLTPYSGSPTTCENKPKLHRPNLLLHFSFLLSSPNHICTWFYIQVTLIGLQIVLPSSWLYCYCILEWLLYLTCLKPQLLQESFLEPLSPQVVLTLLCFVLNHMYRFNSY